MTSDESSDEEEDWFERGVRESAAESADDTTEWDNSDTAEWDDSDTTDESDDTEQAEGDSSGDWTDTVEEPSDDLFSFGDESEDDVSGLDKQEAETLFTEGFGSGVGGLSVDELDDDALDSDIPRLDIGIEGLDEMIQGGIPHKHLIAVIGSAGTGKTTFGLQFLYHGLQHDEKAVFITLEQSRGDVIATANEWGWEFEQYEEDDLLAIVDLDPVEMANSLDNIQAELPTLVREFGADRLVLDSVSLLEMMYDDQAKRRTEVFDFTRSLKRAGVTTFLTSEASESNPYASRHGIVEYLTDAVFILRYIRGEAQETRLAVEIQKIRNAKHSRELKPYEMTDEGISVYRHANIF